MKSCLLCGDFFIQSTGWSTLFDVRDRRGFCGRCWGKFDKIHGPNICVKCGRHLATLEPILVKGDSCSDCVAWASEPGGDILTMNRSLFTYNTFLQDVIARFKFRGDAVLVEGFRDVWRTIYQQHFKGCLPVPIPLSAERLAERHFNQAWILASLLPAPPVDLLVREKHNKKQSKKSRRERLDRDNNPFALADHTANYKGQSFVIIDDIYTTGSTVRRAAQVLKKLQPDAIYSMTLAR